VLGGIRSGVGWYRNCRCLRVRIVNEPLLLFPGEDGFECVGNTGRFLIGIGRGRVVSLGTDVGMSDTARRLLYALARRSIQRNLGGALRFIQVEEAALADECVQQALFITEPGDLLFFLVPDRAGGDAVKRALDVLLIPDDSART
jgi:hypothetical protein